MAVTYNDLNLDTRQRLRLAGLPAATLEARELLCYASGKSRDELRRDGRLYVPADVAARMEELVQRHLNGEPVAYLIGEWEFYGLPLDIDPRVLIPRPDTEVLAAQAIDFVSALPGDPRVLDLCAGSGCVGLAVASQCPRARVTLGDVEEGALKLCRQNIRRNDLSARVSALPMNALEKPSPRFPGPAIRTFAEWIWWAVTAESPPIMPFDTAFAKISVFARTFSSSSPRPPVRFKEER